MMPRHREIIRAKAVTSETTGDRLLFFIRVLDLGAIHFSSSFTAIAQSQLRALGQGPCLCTSGGTPHFYSAGFIRLSADVGNCEGIESGRFERGQSV